jgi:hypothetical protein
MEKIEQKSDATNASTSAESRAALMLLGRRAITEQPTTKQKLSLAFLRRKVLHQQEEAGEKITDLDQLFLSATSVRLDSCDIHAIENLEMLDKLQHVHLQNNYITAIEFIA